MQEPKKPVGQGAEVKAEGSVPLAPRPSPLADGGLGTHEELGSYLADWCQAIKWGRQVPHPCVLGPKGKGKTKLIELALTAAFGPRGAGWLYAGPTTQPADAHARLYGRRSSAQGSTWMPSRCRPSSSRLVSSSGPRLRRAGHAP
jgi:hypothetical protein